MIRIHILIALLFAPACFAQHEGDVGLVIQDNQLQTAVIADGQYLNGEQIFTAAFGDSGFDYFTQNPGWDAAPGTFTPGATFSWSAVAGLKKYESGVGFVASPATLRVSFSTISVTVGAEPTEGFALQVQPDGGFHKHVNFFLQGENGAEPEAGAYLLETQLEIIDSGIAPSQSVYVIFDNMAPEIQTEAAAFLEEALDSSCPADVDGDDSIGFADVLAVLADWGCESCPASDVDGDGLVGFSDVLGVIANWGDC
ncbi:MAG: hypothetical protein AAGK34_07260 [Planctomycetota bacterium]